MRASEFVTEACWSDYQQQGMKRKGNRMVPNCVKKESADQTMPALTSDEVRRIQHVLNVKFGANLDVDGKMGPLTRASIRQLLPAIKKTAAPNPNRTTAVQGGYLKQGMIKNELDEDLRKWFREKWVRFGPDGKIRGDCARGSSSEGKPKCLPQSKAQALGKKGRASAAARKRRQDPNPERSGSAINVATRKKK